MAGAESNSLDRSELIIPSASGRPLITARREGDLVTVATHTRKPGEPAQIAPSDARDLGAALTYLAHLADTDGALPDPSEPGPLTIADEVKVSAWVDAAELIRHVFEQQNDLDGFHWLEDGPNKAWMTQALAVIACDLLGELTETHARLSMFPKKSTRREILAERVSIIQQRQMRRADRRSGS
jgi:hypothetical protein